MGSRAMAPGALSGSRAGAASLDPMQMQGYEGHAVVSEYLPPYGDADRGRSRQRSAPVSHPGPGGMQQAGAAGALGGAFLGAGGSQAAGAAFEGGGRVPRSASAPPGKRHPGSPEEPASDQVLAHLQRTQQELQRQRAEQDEWATAAQQLLRAHGHVVPQAGSPEDAPRQQQWSGTLPPLHPPVAQQRRPASLDLRPSHDLCQAFASLQANLGAIGQQQQGWDARRAAQQADLAQQQAQWEAKRAAEQWNWEMRRQAEEQVWQQARRQQEEAWRDKRLGEEREWLDRRRREEQQQQEWLDRRRREEQEQQERRQRAEQHWQMECRAAQLVQQAAPEQRQLPPLRDLYSQPPVGMPPANLPAQYTGSGGGAGSSGSSSVAPLPLPPVLEGPDSMQMDLLTLDSADFMEMARELGLASPMPSFELPPADPQQAQRGREVPLDAFGPLGHVPQPFSPLPVQQLVGPAPGQAQPAGLAQRQQQQAQRAQQQAASPPTSF